MVKYKMKIREVVFKMEERMTPFSSSSSIYEDKHMSMHIYI